MLVWRLNLAGKSGDSNQCLRLGDDAKGDRTFRVRFLESPSYSDRGNHEWTRIGTNFRMDLKSAVSFTLHSYKIYRQVIISRKATPREDCLLRLIRSADEEQNEKTMRHMNLYVRRPLSVCHPMV